MARIVLGMIHRSLSSIFVYDLQPHSAKVLVARWFCSGLGKALAVICSQLPTCSLKHIGVVLISNRGRVHSQTGHTILAQLKGMCVRGDCQQKLSHG